MCARQRVKLGYQNGDGVRTEEVIFGKMYRNVQNYTLTLER